MEVILSLERTPWPLWIILMRHSVCAIFCGNPLLRLVRPVVPTLILVTCHDPCAFSAAIKVPITIHHPEAI